MNTDYNKMNELCTKLEILENSYNPNSPTYRFNYIFYNVIDSPVERPSNFSPILWNKYFIPNSNLMPVILNREQVEERKIQQNELIMKLNEAKGAILKKIDSLKIKREIIKCKLENVVKKFRERINCVVTGEPCDFACKIKPEILERERLGIKSQKEELIQYLLKVKEKLNNFDKKVIEALRNVEKKPLI